MTGVAAMGGVGDPADQVSSIFKTKQTKIPHPQTPKGNFNHLFLDELQINDPKKSIICVTSFITHPLRRQQ